MRYRILRRWVVAGVACLTALLLVAGCSSGTDSMSDSTIAEGGASPDQQMPSAPSESEAGGWAQDEAADDQAAADSDAAAGHGHAGTDIATGPLTDQRQIIRTASATVEVTVERAETREETRRALADAARDTATAVRALATGVGGYVAASDGSGAMVTVTLRVPAGMYASVLERLESLGRVTSQQESAQDVTDEMVDVESRITTMQTSIDRLRSLMAKAESVADIITIESELTWREADLESLQSRRAALADHVALSTITVTVDAVTSDEVAPDEPERNAFLRGLQAGWDGLMTMGRGAAALIGAVVPFLPLVALVGLGLWWLLRAARRRAGRARPAAESVSDDRPTPASVADGHRPDTP